MDNGQLAFRVMPRRPVPPPSASRQLFAGGDVHVHSRRSHNKSRGGCLNCKQRRKKCDEEKPACKRCSDRNLNCQYYEGVRQRTQKKANIASLPPSLWPGPRAPDVLVSSFNNTDYTDQDLILLDHFIKFSAESLAGDVYGPVYTIQALDIAKEAPFLMHSMLAVAACHIEWLYKGTNTRQYRLIEMFHTQRASQGLCNAVSSFRSPRETDAVLTTSMLLNTVAMCYGDTLYEEHRSTNHAPNWNWLRILLGIKDLLIQARPFQPQSIWQPMFLATRQFTYPDDPINELDKRLAAFCQIDESADPDAEPCHELFAQLAPLVTRPCSVQYLIRYLNAIGGMSYAFVDLLQAQDIKALVLFAHLLGLLCSVSGWWVVRRVKGECWKICRILRDRLEEGDRDLLEFPVRASGFCDGGGDW